MTATHPYLPDPGPLLLAGGTLVVVWLHHAYGDSVLTCGFDEEARWGLPTALESFDARTG